MARLKPCPFKEVATHKFRFELCPSKKQAARNSIPLSQYFKFKFHFVLHLHCAAGDGNRLDAESALLQASSAAPMSLSNLLDLGFDRPRLSAQRQIAGNAQIRRRAGNGSRTELDDREMLAIKHVRAEHALLDLGLLVGRRAWIFHAQRFGLDFEFDVLAGFVHAARSQRRTHQVIIAGEREHAGSTHANGDGRARGIQRPRLRKDRNRGENNPQVRSAKDEGRDVHIVTSSIVLRTSSIFMIFPQPKGLSWLFRSVACEVTGSAEIPKEFSCHALPRRPSPMWPPSNRAARRAQSRKKSAQAHRRAPQRWKKESERAPTSFIRSAASRMDP